MLRYIRDLPLNAPQHARILTAEHVRAHLSAIADGDDDPHTFAADVRVTSQTIPGECIRVEGVLDEEAVAEYLTDHYDPYAECPDDLRREATR